MPDDLAAAQAELDALRAVAKAALHVIQTAKGSADRTAPVMVPAHAFGRLFSSVNTWEPYNTDTQDRPAYIHLGVVH